MANGHKGKKKAKNPVGTIMRLLAYIGKEYKLAIFVVLSCILIGSIAQVQGSLFLQVLIDDHILPLLNETYPNYTGLITAIMTMAGIYAIGVISSFIYTRLMVTIAQGVQKKIRDEMFSHMQSLSIQFFDSHAHGDLMSRYTNDVDTLRQMLSQSIPQVFASIITMITITIGMFTVSVPLTFIVLTFVAIMMLTAKKITAISGKNFVKQQKTLGELNGYVEEMIQGQKVVKVFSYEGEAKQQFDRLNANLEQSAKDANKFANILMPVLGNLGHLLYVIVAIAGGSMAIYGVGGLTLGAIATFLQLSRSFVMPVSQIALQANSIVMALAGAERIFELMDQQSEFDEGEIRLVNAKYENNDLTETAERTGIWAWKQQNLEGHVTYTEVKGDVQLANVEFSYNENKQILFDVSVYASPGEKVAFVGSTGAGKTTITNLINRFYEIQGGQILYDGIDITKINKSDLRRSLGVVLQETNLFTGTILENIRYGRLNATDEEVYEAAKLANAHEFIMRLPDGYQTVLTGNGEALSQGQRQLLNIARAAVADPPVIILDEATSSIDTRTESIVQRGLDALMNGRTVFVIAHRLSTIRNSDVIMVMEAGRIIERGNHEELLERQGKYYQLYTGAFELE